MKLGTVVVLDSVSKPVGFGFGILTRVGVACFSGQRPHITDRPTAQKIALRDLSST